MTREDVLNEAKKCVCGHREHDYGTPEDNFTTISYLWSVYLKASHPKLNIPVNEITAKDVAVMMSLLKIARIATTPTPDSFVDLAGYAACAGEIATKNTPAHSSENTCLICGVPIPEGMHVCPSHSGVNVCG